MASERRDEEPINLEKIVGGRFLVPAIVGEDSGRGFRIENLRLPLGWQKGLDELGNWDQEEFGEDLRGFCRRIGIAPGTIEFDPATGIITEITIASASRSRLHLARGFSFQEMPGVYETEEVSDLKTAYVLFHFATAGLNWIRKGMGSKDIYPQIGGEPGNYRPLNLVVPRDFLRAGDSQFTASLLRREFELKASNIAGRFGRDLQSIKFNERGLLISFEVNGGSCGFGLLLDRGMYIAHNVEHLDQAAALFGIGAAFINDLLDQKELQPIKQG